MGWYADLFVFWQLLAGFLGFLIALPFGYAYLVWRERGRIEARWGPLSYPQPRWVPALALVIPILLNVYFFGAPVVGYVF